MALPKKAFTLIELIIVVIIIAILAATALPRYYASVTKTNRNAVFTNLHLIKDVILGYYAAYGTYPASGSFPITVTIEGDTILSVARPRSTGRTWNYWYSITGEDAIYAWTESGGTRDCEYVLRFSDNYEYQLYACSS